MNRSPLLPVVILTVVFEASAAFAAPATYPDTMQFAGRSVKLIYDQYGLPKNELDALLRYKRTADARNILARTPRRPGDEDVRQIWLSACLSTEQRYEDAAAGFAQVKDISRGSAFSLYLAARTYLELGDYAKAIELCNIAISRGKSYETLDLRAKCYAALKKPDEAARDFAQAAVVTPRRASEYYVQAANVMMRANRPEEGLAYAEKAPLGMPGQMDALTFLTQALCLEKPNRWTEAETYLSKAVLVCEKAQETQKFAEPARVCLCHVLQERVICYEKLGQKSKAAATRQAAEKLTRELESDLIGKGH